MNSLEMDEIATSVVMYLQSKSDSPLDAIGALGMALLKIFDEATQGMTIETFAKDFHDSLIESYKARSSSSTNTMQ